MKILKAIVVVVAPIALFAVFARGVYDLGRINAEREAKARDFGPPTSVRLMGGGVMNLKGDPDNPAYREHLRSVYGITIEDRPE